ncbi:hypothetical protein IE53DRAFT_80952 [Violaceomyces palustris]|uniref:Uncharacterized protein n=1 Tax=Violaceomyces palustris TaxID=1673888 RepID=A0ACD0NY92_9BASI|nr:hypothetical protein IE53DRAFT_80952 [Violaceomyces palustris]
MQRRRRTVAGPGTSRPLLTYNPSRETLICHPPLSPRFGHRNRKGEARNSTPRRFITCRTREPNGERRGGRRGEPPLESDPVRSGFPLTPSSFLSPARMMTVQHPPSLSVPLPSKSPFTKKVARGMIREARMTATLQRQISRNLRSSVPNQPLT